MLFASDMFCSGDGRTLYGGLISFRVRRLKIEDSVLCPYALDVLSASI